ncbi:hypothetical protein [Janthinobacterium sp. RA13]|uniref:hypothetical protein n=1 Tax=Janthinobacterium sp. RA13 TaxID=1502762 RepID=UPI001F1B7AF1|nr:hypothetical protein [Janthinobacterium sp. RA13]
MKKTSAPAIELNPESWTPTFGVFLWLSIVRSSSWMWFSNACGVRQESKQSPGNMVWIMPWFGNGFIYLTCTDRLA